MSSSALELPGSVQRTLKVDSTQQDIRNLAYALWRERGAPLDESSGADWKEAEQRLQAEQAKSSSQR